MYGDGQVGGSQGQVVLSQTPDSEGVMLISPEVYCGDTILRFDLKTLTPTTIMISNIATLNSDGTALAFPEDYDGDSLHMYENFGMYNFVYSVEPHDRPGPFFRRFPNPGSQVHLNASDRQFVTYSTYHAIEIGHIEDRIWLSIDGRTVTEWIDPEPLEGGHVVFRVVGAAHERGAVFLRNVRISNNLSVRDCVP